MKKLKINKKNFIILIIIIIMIIFVSMIIRINKIKRDNNKLTSIIEEKDKQIGLLNYDIDSYKMINEEFKELFYDSIKHICYDEVKQ